MIAVKKLGNEEEMEDTIKRAREGGLLVEAEVDRAVFERVRRWRIKIGLEDLIVDLKGVALRPGDVLLTDQGKLVVLRKKREKVVKFTLRDPNPAFKLGFLLGNLHAQVMYIDPGKVAIAALLPEDYYINVFRDFSPEFASKSLSLT